MSSTSQTIVLGFSPCPNDTFMFHGLVHGEVALDGIVLQPVLADIEVLNRRALGLDGAKPLAITKVSVAVLPQLLHDYEVLDAGAALGRGCGPLVVRRSGGPSTLADLAGTRVAVPGLLTTASLLLRMFAPKQLELVPMRFDEIMPAVAAGDVDAGTIIHESRFTYAEHGLEPIDDLGVCWERETDLPLPLGVIVARRELGSEVIRRFEAALRRSVEAAMADPERTRNYVREHARELSDHVCRQHIALYVNEFSRSLGREGRAAIHRLLAAASPEAA